MNDNELGALIRDWSRSEAADGPSASLRPSILAIPALVARPPSGQGSRFGDPRRLMILAALLALTVAIGGALAIGSGLVQLPWQQSTRIHPGAIDPCSLVAGGPSAETRNFDGDTVDAEEDANLRPPRINSFDGGGCLFLQTDDDPSSFALVQLRNEVTTTEQATEVAARLFRMGRAPFSSGPVHTFVDGHPAWVGRLAVPGQGSDDPSRVGMAVSAAPYFFIVVIDVRTALDLSDGAGLIWWEDHVEQRARTLARELLAKLEGL